MIRISAVSMVSISKPIHIGFRMPGGITRYGQQVRNNRSERADQHGKTVLGTYLPGWFPPPVLIQAHLGLSRALRANGHNLRSADTDRARWRVSRISPGHLNINNCIIPGELMIPYVP